MLVMQQDGARRWLDAAGRESPVFAAKPTMNEELQEGSTTAMVLLPWRCCRDGHREDFL